MAERINFSYFLMVKTMGKMEPVGMVEIMVTAKIMEVVSKTKMVETMEVVSKMEMVKIMEVVSKMEIAEITEVVKMARTMETMEVKGKMEIMVKLVRLVLEAVMKPQVLAKAKMM